MSKVIVILGPTSSGKTGLAVRLALKFNGEIVSADSRQVYRGMDIGTGKDLGEYEIKTGKTKIRIPHHLIDVCDPKKEFDLSRYQKLSREAIKDILDRKKLPIVAGGTGLYLQAVVDGYELPPVKPDKSLRRELEKKSVSELYARLKRLKPLFAKKIHESDRKNKRRLIRYLEIALSRPEVLAVSKVPPKKKDGFEFLILGIRCDKEVLFDRIEKRLSRRLKKENLVAEVERLHCEGLSWKRLESFGLEYRHIALYLQDKLEYDEMEEKLGLAIKKYAKKQLSWYRRWERQGRKIKWVKSHKEAEALIMKFLS